MISRVLVGVDRERGVAVRKLRSQRVVVSEKLCATVLASTCLCNAHFRILGVKIRQNYIQAQCRYKLKVRFAISMFHAGVLKQTKSKICRRCYFAGVNVSSTASSYLAYNPSTVPV